MNERILERNKLRRKVTKTKRILSRLSIDLNEKTFVGDIIALMQYHLEGLKYLLFKINSLDADVNELELLTKVQCRLKKKRRTDER